MTRSRWVSARFKSKFKRWSKEWRRDMRAHCPEYRKYLVKASSKFYYANEEYRKREYARAKAKRTPEWWKRYNERIRGRRGPRGLEIQKTRARKYGMTLVEVIAFVKKRKGRCDACRTRKKIKRQRHHHLDHDHKTGRVRGLLCHRCNTALGYVKDNPRVLLALVAYLKRTAR